VSGRVPANVTLKGRVSIAMGRASGRGLTAKGRASGRGRGVIARGRGSTSRGKNVDGRKPTLRTARVRARGKEVARVWGCVGVSARVRVSGKEEVARVWGCLGVRVGSVGRYLQVARSVGRDIPVIGPGTREITIRQGIPLSGRPGQAQQVNFHTCTELGQTEQGQP